MLAWIKEYQKAIVYIITIVSVVAIPFYIRSLEIFSKAGGGFVDLRVTLLAGQRIFNHELIYNAQDIAQDMPYLYAPCFAYVMGLYRIIITPERLAIFIWFLSCYLFLGLILKLSLHITEETYEKNSHPWFFYPVLLFLCLRYFLSNIQLGQINIFLDFLLLLSLYFLYHKREFLSGALLAIATLIKLPFLIFILFFLFQKKWKALFSFFITALILLFSPALHLGWHENLFFLTQWKSTLATKSSVILNFKNQSLISFYARGLHFLFKDMEFQKLYTYSYLLSIFTAIPLLISSTIIYFFKEKTKWIKFFGLASCFMIFMVILSPSAWRATFIHLLFPYCFILMYWWNREKKCPFIPRLLILSFVLSSFITGDLFGGSLNTFIHQTSFIFISSLVVLYLLFIIPSRIRAQQDSNLQPSD